MNKTCAVRHAYRWSFRLQTWYCPRCRGTVRQLGEHMKMHKRFVEVEGGLRSAQ